MTAPCHRARTVPKTAGTVPAGHRAGRALRGAPARSRSASAGVPDPCPADIDLAAVLDTARRLGFVVVSQRDAEPVRQTAPDTGTRPTTPLGQLRARGVHVNLGPNGFDLLTTPTVRHLARD